MLHCCYKKSEAALDEFLIKNSRSIRGHPFHGYYENPDPFYCGVRLKKQPKVDPQAVSMLFSCMKIKIHLFSYLQIK